MEDLEIARRVRETPQLSGIELVALTGYGLPEDRTRAEAAGFAYHLTKPVDPKVLRSLVATIHAARPAR